jgi:cobalt-precorrin 5A hydrolase/precorrin-3B C17-methyltransferase
LWIGIGCERGIAVDSLEQAVRESLQQQGLALASVAGLASIELKQDEAGLLDLAARYGWKILFFSAAELALQPVPNPSDQVAVAVGTPSVAEAAALRAAQTKDLIIPKQIRYFESGACTVAVARSQQETSSRLGQLWLIGTGPGSLDQMTVAARTALVQAEVVIGYQLYLDLIQPLFRVGQVIEGSAITQEMQRAERAITLAQQGLRVAVVSSGDAGIYGMAGLVLECLARRGWDGADPQVEVLPGITALQAAAARVGAPFMQDFCAISLSDLLTPWSVIQQRLEAAAAADFVVALYNPRSQKRTQGIVAAHQLFLQHRPKETPVVLARSVYREEEKILLTTLADLQMNWIDMLTIVLIGNHKTWIHQNRVITPRGYQIPTE